MKKFKIEIPARLNYSEFVRLFASEMAWDAGLTKQEVNIVKLITDELYINAVRYWSKSDSIVIIEWSYKKWSITLSVEDQWAWKDKINDKDLHKIIEQELLNDDPKKTHWRWLAQITSVMASDFKISKWELWWLRIEFTKNSWEEKPQVKREMNTKEKEFINAKEKKVFALSWDIWTHNMELVINPVNNYLEGISYPAIIIFDCSNLEYINTIFIWNLATWHTHLNSFGWEVRIRNANDFITNIIDLIWLKNLIKFENESV